MIPSAINQQMAAIDDSALFLQNTQLLAQLQGNPSLYFSGVKAPAAPTMMRAIPQPMMGMDPGSQKSVMLPQQNGLNGGVGQNARPAMLHDRGNKQAALMHALAQQQAQINGANAYLQNNNAAVAAAAQQAAQVRAAQAQACATVANMLQQQQQLATRQQQQQRLNQQQAVLGQNMAFNQAVNAAIQRAAANGQNLNMPNTQQQQQQQLQQQQITMEAATQIVQQYQAQQAEQACRAELLRQAHSLAQNQQAATSAGNSAVALQVLVKQAQLKEALARQQQQQQQRPMQHQQQRPQQMGGYPFSHAQHLQAQQQQVAAQAHQQQQVQQAQLQAHVQQAQLQAQAQARHNMATLANLTPAQLQAISTNPTLAQAVIQARAQAQLAQAQARVNPSNPVPINNLAEAHNAQLNDQRLRQQQQQARAMAAAAAAAQGGAQGILGPPDLTSPVSSNAGSPPGGTNGESNMGQHMNKEQRRMALACVALQLARSGLSMDQAIHSGIMGGMSVTDVRFIVDVYNAEMTRMKEGGAEGGGHGEKHAMNSAKLNVHTAPSSRLNSPDSPARSSCAGSENGHGVFSGGSVHAGQSSRTGSALGGALDSVQDLSNFDAFSYGFFGAGGQEELEGGLGDVLLGELEELGGAMEELPLPLDDTAGVDVQQLSSWNGPGRDLVDGRLRGADAVKAVKKEDDVAERLANLDLGYGFF
ncbi:hypothetical protein CEUSTIGMA_g7841.t1 [Chlamydomonas eustigma]|uniref:Uncharacterized protein n=1 Tax=Chlamydomonas eustigma TaxID=1157962 RepID=A0A250XC01_9CHLO|nr:hypothetical protein CEUSTIGMA_g7841.t1 [Chlamydomonas eustigma]|eukprot:GAX80402.1 hypothetical protein CEUSTIGMA_g7841.t1 [Chlamydomonas eustigma]